eukprot:749867-Amphidinium_carterae.1
MDQSHSLPATRGATTSEPMRKRHWSPPANSSAAPGAHASATRQKIGASPSQSRKQPDPAI